MTILPALSESQIIELREQIRLGRVCSMPILSGDYPGVSIEIIDKAAILLLFEDVIDYYWEIVAAAEGEGFVDSNDVREEIRQWRQRLDAALGKNVVGDETSRKAVVSDDCR